MAVSKQSRNSKHCIREIGSFHVFSFLDHRRENTRPEIVANWRMSTWTSKCESKKAPKVLVPFLCLQSNMRFSRVLGSCPCLFAVLFHRVVPEKSSMPPVLHGRTFQYYSLVANSKQNSTVQCSIVLYSIVQVRWYTPLLSLSLSLRIRLCIDVIIDCDKRPEKKERELLSDALFHC